VSRYRAIVWTGAAAALAIVLFVPPPPQSSMLFPAIATAGNMLVALAAWLWAYRAARAHAMATPAVRVASLAPRDMSLPGGALFACGPFGILVAAALLVYAYSERPVEHRALGSIGPLGAGALFVTMMMTMAVSLARQTRQVTVDGAAAAAEQQFRRVNVFLLEVTAYAMAVLVSANTLNSLPAFANNSTSGGWLWLAPMMLFNFGVMFWMLRVGQGGQRAVARRGRLEVHGDATPDSAWKIAGLFYFNPGDSAIWVEKRVGLGYTLNLANWRAWLLLVMVLAFMLAAPRLFSMR